jgi:hypothetical protein
VGDSESVSGSHCRGCRTVPEALAGPTDVRKETGTAIADPTKGKPEMKLALLTMLLLPFGTVVVLGVLKILWDRVVK